MKDSAFQKEQITSIYPEGIEVHYWNSARTRVLLRVIGMLGLEKGSILEIGCGRGHVVQALRREGYEAYGVDVAHYSDQENSVSWLEYGIDFKNVTSVSHSAVNVVLLLDVIEHIEDAEEFLGSVRETFPNLTHVIVTVPARKEIWSNFDTYNQHYRRYSRKTLMETMEASGLQVSFISYLFHALYLPARMLAFLGLDRNIVIQAPKSFLTYLHWAVAQAFYVEYLLLPARLVGTSLIAVGRIKP